MRCATAQRWSTGSVIGSKLSGAAAGSMTLPTPLPFAPRASPMPPTIASNLVVRVALDANVIVTARRAPSAAQFLGLQNLLRRLHLEQTPRARHSFEVEYTAR